MAEIKRSNIKFKRGLYINREYSWLNFNKRVLLQSLDTSNPLFERCKFLSIFSSNLDEFFMVRMGGLINADKINPLKVENKTKLTSEQQVSGVYSQINKIYKDRNKVFKQIKAQLKNQNIHLLNYKDLSETRKKRLDKYFTSSVLPFLSPMVLDAKHPLVKFENLACYIVYKLKKNDRVMIGIMQLNKKLEKLYLVPTRKNVCLITQEEIVRNLGYKCFIGYKMQDSMMIRVTRNADFVSNLEDADVEYNYDFAKLLKSKVQTRGSQNAVRLEYLGESKTLKKFLLDNLNIDEKFMFKVDNGFEYKYMFDLQSYVEKDKLKQYLYPYYKPRVAKNLQSPASIIEEVRKGDILMAYPFDGIDPLIDLLNECANSKTCISIRITIYRLASHSRIVEALKRASENGKEVTVVMEILARFDEENNMHFAKLLQQAGCNIIYGVDNFKVHSKIISIVFSDGDEISYITHLGTGNYNESTAKQYTDLNIITANKEIGEDGTAFFRNILIGNIDYKYKRLNIAPKYLKQMIIENIDSEIQKANNGKKASIIAKMNSLTDKDIIDKLIEGSKAGVKINLIVRGICCLIPKIVGKTDNIRVISIVGRFLEHSRVYCFGEDKKIYISSADLMTRNIDKRVEIATPVLDEKIKEKIYDMLMVALNDNQKAYELNKNGEYEKVTNDKPCINSQEYFISKMEVL